RGGEGLQQLGAGFLLGDVVRARVGPEVVVHLGVVEALDGRRASNATGVEADDVVVLPDRVGGDHVGPLGVVDTGSAGTAGVDHQRSLPAVAGGHPAQRDPA